MSFFTGKTKMVNTTPIPSSTTNSNATNGKVTKEAAVALIHNHDFFLKTDPHYVSHRTLAPTTQGEKEAQMDAVTAKQTYELPRDVDPVSQPPVRVYEVVDHVPNPVWSSSVVSREELVDVKDGVFVRIRSPLAVVMETRWSVRERKRRNRSRSGSDSSSRSKGGDSVKNGDGDEEAELELVEDVEITCSKFLIGIVKGQVDNGWEGIHARIVARMVEDAKKTARA